jgi:hypothetical protein
LIFIILENVVLVITTCPIFILEGLIFITLENVVLVITQFVELTIGLITTNVSLIFSKYCIYLIECFRKASYYD